MTIKNLTLLSAFALGAPLFAAAQAEPTTPAPMPATSALTPAPDPGSVDPGPGLIGTNYAELSYGYQHYHDSPTSLHDYEFFSNTAAYRTGIVGFDGDFLYEHTNADDDGFSDRRDQLEMGGTGFLTEIWGKPFLSADAGMAWEHVGGFSRKGFVYDLQSGVEFEVLGSLAITPFIGYEALPKLYNHVPTVADFPDHAFEYGVKETYRLTRNWKASLTETLDQYSSRDWGLRGGVSYRF